MGCHGLGVFDKAVSSYFGRVRLLPSRACYWDSIDMRG